MVNKLSLRCQIYLVLALLVSVVIVGGLVIISYTNQIKFIQTKIITNNLVNYQKAEALENALIRQKGFVTYFYLDKNPDWLKQLGVYRQVFKEHLKKMNSLSKSIKGELETIRYIEKDYKRYIELQDRVIDFYSQSNTEAGLKLHKNVREYFLNIMQACEDLKKIQKQSINQAWEDSQKKSQRLISSVVITVSIVTMLVIVLIVTLVMRILDPLQRLSLEATKDKNPKSSTDEIIILSKNVRGLIKEADLAQAALKQNREILIQSEKLALVGKLAAGMAHSIRNPLTSVKMRLFSLNRSLKLNASQKDDFDVISEEIKHLDIIVQNFLEFSRPPKLRMQPLSLSMVVDQSLQLLQHRLKSYNAEIELQRNGTLPQVMGDAEQLKEVFVNLIVNSCESMEKGGCIKIIEEQKKVENILYSQVQLEDTGPGIPDAIIGKIFQPFFTTKDEGTGLGLSIASRIIEDHHGFLSVESKSGQGTQFTMLLPVIGVIS